jgi:G3E family GTPase
MKIRMARWIVNEFGELSIISNNLSNSSGKWMGESSPLRQ